MLLHSELVLTCAHFFRSGAEGTRIHVAGVQRTLRDLTLIRGTDVAIATIAPVKIPAGSKLPQLGPPPRHFHRTATFGYGGKLRYPAARAGFYLGAFPVSASRSFQTLVRPAGFVYNSNPAVKGDSGGPIVAGGRIFGVQSLILDPVGINLGIATVSLIAGDAASGVNKLLLRR